MFSKVSLYRNKLLTLIVILLPALVRILNFNLFRIHGDDLLLAYYSSKYEIFKTNIFAPVPANITDLENQFASGYFLLQKIFFLIFGESLFSIKLSIIPYVLLDSVFLYLIVKLLINKRTALISLILYSFLAISLYMETNAINTISSTPFFLAFFYFFLISLRQGRLYQILLTGIFCALCYLFATASYIALPLLIFLGFLHFFITKRWEIIINTFTSVMVCLIILLPFFHYMYLNKNYYLLQRINQVNLINGSWNNQQQKISKIFQLKSNFQKSIKSLYQDGIGGHGGYDFGRLALFERVSLLLTCFGLILALIFYRKKFEFLYLILLIICNFILGIVLTIPPPAYHRFILAFPLLTVIMSIPFDFIFKSKINYKLKYVIAIVILIIYIFSNEKYFLHATAKENSNVLLKMGNYLDNYLPSRKIYIAAYPGYAFEKIYYFFPGSKYRSILTDYHASLLSNFNKDEKYVYVLTFSHEFFSKFKEIDSSGRIINFQDDFAIFYN